MANPATIPGLRNRGLLMPPPPADIPRSHIRPPQAKATATKAKASREKKVVSARKAPAPAAEPAAPAEPAPSEVVVTIDGPAAASAKVRRMGQRGVPSKRGGA